MFEHSNNSQQTPRQLYCPACGVLLETTERDGVEIDYCPLCQAIWLQRGELNTLIDRSTEKRALARSDDARREAQARQNNPTFNPRDPAQPPWEWFDFG